MIHKPDLPDEEIIICLQTEYELRIVEVDFLPLGFGLNTAVYRAIADNKSAYFCKLRRDVFDFSSVELSKFLSEQGIAQIIPPIETKVGQLGARVREYNLFLYPFIEGKNGYEVELKDFQWADLGRALRRIQTTIIPPAILKNIQKETYTSKWREKCKQFLARLDIESFDDPVMIELTILLRSKNLMILNLIKGAERLAPIVAARNQEHVLCHSDLHPGNLLIGENGNIYIVDWDYPILSPKERDLMYIGGGFGFLGHTEMEQGTLFYSGYGEHQINPVTLPYYRLERSIIAIVVACEHILSSEQDNQTRAQIFGYLKYYFRPNGAIETALKSYERSISIEWSIPKKIQRKRLSVSTIISFAILLLAWQVTTSLSHLPSFILPSPMDVWSRLVRALLDGTLLANSITTLAEVVLGLGIGSLIATVTGYFMAKSRLLDNLLSPFLVVSQAVPFVAVAPLLIIWFGSGIFSKILICSLIVFFPILINTVVGIRAVPIALYDLMRSMRATPFQILVIIELPAALPIFLSGLRIGATLSVIGAVVGEFLGANRGLGFLVNMGRGQFDTPLVYASVLVLILMALGLYGSVAWIERLALQKYTRK